jgi:hypothetical protein
MPYLNDVLPQAPAPSTQGSSKPRYLSDTLPSYNARAEQISNSQQKTAEMQDQTRIANSPAGIARNTGADVLNFGKNTLHDMLSALTQKGPKTTTNVSEGMDSIAGAGFKVIADNFNNMGDKLNTAVSTLTNNHASLLDKGISVGSAGMATLQGLFSVVSAPLASASKTPGIAPVANAVNNLFNAIGTGGADVASKALDSLPVSNETREKLRPLVSDLGALAGQILVGKVGGDVVGNYAGKAHDLVSTVVKNVDTAKIANDAYPVIQAKQVASQKVAARQAKSSAFEASQREPYIAPEDMPSIQYEGGPVKNPQLDSLPVMDITPPKEEVLGPDRFPHTYTAPEDLPVIEMGPPAKSDLPVIQLEPKSKPYNGEYTLSPIEQERVASAKTPEEKELVYEAISQRNQAMQEPFVTDVPNTRAPAPDSISARAAAERGDAPTTTKEPSGLALSTNAKAIERGLMDSFGDLPEYKSKSIRAGEVAEYVENNYEGAVNAVLKGKVPNDFIPTVVYKAVEDKALREGDYETISRLASKENKLSGQVSTGGQLLSGLSGDGSPSPVDLINEIRQARQARVARKTGKGTDAEAPIKETVKELEKAEKDTPIPKSDWDEFLNTISCNY